MEFIFLMMMHSGKCVQIRKFLEDIRSKMSCAMCQFTGPTAIYARKFVESESVLSTWLLFLDNKMMRHIKNAHKPRQRVLATDNWTVMLDELYAFIAILYARGANGIDSHCLWSNS